MSGYLQILKIRRLEEQIAHLGFRWRACYRDGPNMDLLELTPLEDPTILPVYSRDAPLFAGTIEELEVWLRGVAWARNYDRLLDLSDNQKRLEKETQYLERETFNKLKNKT